MAKAFLHFSQNGMLKSPTIITSHWPHSLTAELYTTHQRAQVSRHSHQQTNLWKACMQCMQCKLCKNYQNCMNVFPHLISSLNEIWKETFGDEISDTKNNWRKSSHSKNTKLHWTVSTSIKHRSNVKKRVSLKILQNMCKWIHIFIFRNPINFQTKNNMPTPKIYLRCDSYFR